MKSGSSILIFLERSVKGAFPTDLARTKVSWDLLPVQVADEILSSKIKTRSFHLLSGLNTMKEHQLCSSGAQSIFQ